MTITLASVADASELERIAAITWPLASPPDMPPDAIERFIDANLTRPHFEAYVADPDRRVLTARLDGTLVGWGLLVFGEPADPTVGPQLRLHPTVELSKIYVLTDHHGHGIAQALLTRALEEGRAGGATGMWLGTNQRNARAQRFYDKSGFTQVGTKQFDVGGRVEDDFIYEIAL